MQVLQEITSKNFNQNISEIQEDQDQEQELNTDQVSQNSEANGYNPQFNQVQDVAYAFNKVKPQPQLDNPNLDVHEGNANPVVVRKIFMGIDGISKAKKKIKHDLIRRRANAD